MAQEGIQDLGDVDRVWEEGRSSGVLSVVDRQTAEDRKERGGKSPVSCPGRGAAEAPISKKSLPSEPDCPPPFISPDTWTSAEAQSMSISPGLAGIFSVLPRRSSVGSRLPLLQPFP